MLKDILVWTAVGVSAYNISPFVGNTSKLRVETFVNSNESFDMVSSLIIGSKAAVIVDLPLAIPQAQALASWVRKTTDKPLVAAFSTHFHPDHYLSGAAFLEQFPDTPFYANSKTVGHMKNEVSDVVQQWSNVIGTENVVPIPTIPEPYDFTLFTLPGDEASPVHILSTVVGDTVDASLFWIPSISVLIAGDLIIANSLHVWVADLLTPALTASWLSTLNFIEKLRPRLIIPGHSETNVGFGPTRDLEHSKKYLSLFQTEIEAKGINFYTPQEIFDLLDVAFPGITQSNTSSSALVLNFTANEFGRGGPRYSHHVDLKSFTNITELHGWALGKY
ncbi:beta-lactamase-like protein [Pyrenochaeta sp. MPI-SDFR-AT-0127]|nr:beta-lactamase-like protein [Pyrenochaeta sp. MPI-SDFR-AT-0127]